VAVKRGLNLRLKQKRRDVLDKNLAVDAP